MNHWSLKNGAKCILAPIPEAPLTCLDLWCKAGSANEEPGEEGLAHFLEHMVFKGSSRLKAGEFDLKIEALGGSSNAATGFDDVHFFVLIPPQKTSEALELLLNLVLTPLFETKEYCLEREVVLEEIAQYNDEPDEQAIQQLLGKCLEGHPYGRPILGEAKSLKKSNPELMRSFHERKYIGKNCCLAISGAIPKGIEYMINNSELSELSNTNSNTPINNYLSQKMRFLRGRDEIYIPRLESVRLLMAWEFPAAVNQQMIMGADIATTLLSEGRRSRLVQRLREDLRIVESIDLDVTTLEKGSLILLEACCEQENISLVEKEIHNLLISSLADEISPFELRRASQLVKNGLQFSLESTSQVSGMAGSNSLWGRDQDLLTPLKFINYWNQDRLRKKIFTKIQPENSYTLIARPK